MQRARLGLRSFQESLDAAGGCMTPFSGCMTPMHEFDKNHPYLERRKVLMVKGIEPSLLEGDISDPPRPLTRHRCGKSGRQSRRDSRKCTRLRWKGGRFGRMWRSPDTCRRFRGPFEPAFQGVCFPRSLELSDIPTLQALEVGSQS